MTIEFFKRSLVQLILFGRRRRNYFSQFFLRFRLLGVGLRRLFRGLLAALQFLRPIFCLLIYRPRRAERLLALFLFWLFAFRRCWLRINLFRSLTLFLLWALHRLLNFVLLILFIRRLLLLLL